MRLSSQLWRSFAALIFLVSVLLLALILHMEPFWGDSTDEDFLMEGYFVNTSGCRIQALNPSSHVASKYMRDIKSMACKVPQVLRGETENGKNYLVLRVSAEEILKIFAVRRVSDVLCKYTPVVRVDDFHNDKGKDTSFLLSTRYPRTEVKGCERFVRTMCFGEGHKLAYHDVHFFLPAVASPSPHGAQSSAGRPNRLSVMVLGIDSISHMHFLRMMPATAAFIRQRAHVEFWGYSRVGLNSYPNLIALLSGASEEELEAGCYQERLFFDQCKFLWNHFKAAGYITSFGEDNSNVGTFTYGKLGFKDQPTDFYLRPVMNEISQHTLHSLDRKELIHCSAGRHYADILHEFIEKLMPHMSSGDHFSFFWETQGVHDYFNYARLLDGKYLKLFRHFASYGILDSTFVLFLADHGLRFGSFRSTNQGMFEESLPMFIALYPRWLTELCPLALSNLRRNSRRLTTTFDLHATVKDLTNIKLLHNGNIERRSAQLRSLGRNIPRGISLFLPIPEIRDCKLAGIPSHFCHCRQLRQISNSDKIVLRTADFVVESINALVKDHRLCQRLHLAQVLEAFTIGQPKDGEVFEVMVRLQTMPGKGLFEATTRILPHSLALNGAITRINRYGNDSYCANDFRIEMYCYCL